MSSPTGAPLPDFEFPYTAPAPGGQNGRVSLLPTPSATGPAVPLVGAITKALHRGRGRILERRLLRPQRHHLNSPTRKLLRT